MNTFYYIIATFFFSGKFPFGPGTLASLISLPIYFVMSNNPILYWGVLLSVIILGTFSSNYVSIENNDEDPKYVVIDEVAGMGVSLLFAPGSILYFAIAFVLFRLLDIFKLPFIKKVEHIKNGIGIMLDDILSGIITMIIMIIVHRAGIL